MLICGTHMEPVRVRGYHRQTHTHTYSLSPGYERTLEKEQQARAAERKEGAEEGLRLVIAAYMEALTQTNQLRAAGATRRHRLPLEEISRVKKLVSSLQTEIKQLTQN